jgi:hypothetical protein
MRSGSIVVPILLGVFFPRIDLVPAFLIDALTFLLSAGLVRSPIYRFALPIIATGPLEAGESGYKLLPPRASAAWPERSWPTGRCRGGRQCPYDHRRLGGIGVRYPGGGVQPALAGAAWPPGRRSGPGAENFGNPYCIHATGVFLQKAVPREHIGKVSGLYNSLDMTGDYGGLLLMPILMSWFSAESILAGGGLATIRFCASALVWSRNQNAEGYHDSAMAGTPACGAGAHSPPD